MPKFRVGDKFKAINERDHILELKIMSIINENSYTCNFLFREGNEAIINWSERTIDRHMTRKNNLEDYVQEKLQKFLKETLT